MTGVGRVAGPQGGRGIMYFVRVERVEGRGVMYFRVVAVIEAQALFVGSHFVSANGVLAACDGGGVQCFNFGPRGWACVTAGAWARSGRELRQLGARWELRIAFWRRAKLRLWQRHRREFVFVTFKATAQQKRFFTGGTARARGRGVEVPRSFL